MEVPSSLLRGIYAGVSLSQDAGHDFYVLLTRNGKIERQGVGLSFYYFALTSRDCLGSRLQRGRSLCVLGTLPADFQDVTVQGMLTYRIQDAVKVASLLDYTVDTWQHPNQTIRRSWASGWCKRHRPAHRSFIQSRPLRSVLVTSNELVESVAAALRAAATITQLGIEILDVAIAALKPDPEIVRGACRRRLASSSSARRIGRSTNGGGAAVELERTIP